MIASSRRVLLWLCARSSCSEQSRDSVHLCAQEKATREHRAGLRLSRYCCCCCYAPAPAPAPAPPALNWSLKPPKPTHLLLHPSSYRTSLSCNGCTASSRSLRHEIPRVSAIAVAAAEVLANVVIVLLDAVAVSSRSSVTITVLSSYLAAAVAVAVARAGAGAVCRLECGIGTRKESTFLVD